MGLFFSPLGAGRKIFKAQPSYHSFTDKRETLVQDLLIDHHSSVSQPLHLPLRSTRHRRSSPDRHSAAGSRLAAPPQIDAAPARCSSPDRCGAAGRWLAAPPEIDAAPPGAGSPLLPRSTQRNQRFQAVAASPQIDAPPPAGARRFLSLLVTGELILLQIPINPSIILIS